jgi:endo-1,4-beta-xylanase
MRWRGADGERYRALLAREFGMLVPENDMKHARIHPARGRFAFARADSIVAFAEANRMPLRGHTLVWHRQVAPWLARGTWKPGDVRALLEEHIDSVAGRYRGRIAAWDVVNEALEEDSSLRRSFWLEQVGPEYIELAFRRAHAADPSALLFYNDFNIEGLNAKSDSAYALIRRLLARGVPVHGIGLQAHFPLGAVPATLDANIARFAALGLRVHITELDVRVPLPATPEKLAAQARDYGTVVAACLRHEACDAILTWGVSDRESWIPREFRGFGAALLFDRSFAPKPAHRAVREALRAGSETAAPLPDAAIGPPLVPER